MTETDRPGPGVDATGRPAGRPIGDPTANVLQLVDAAVRRLDDIAEMRAEHQRYVAELRAKYDQRLREAETGRINAVREVDVSAVAAASAASATQAAVLAAQLATTAEAARTGSSVLAAATESALRAVVEPMIRDIADLRRVQYEQAGQRSQVVESRDVRGEKRLDWGQVLTVAALLAAVILGVMNLRG